MKFTEGYWLPSEKANASHAMQAYEVEQIPGGMRILATTRPIEHRGMTLNLPTITVEFVAHTPDTISMEAWHYEAYDNKVPSFDKTESVYEDVTVTINEEEAVLDTGKRTGTRTEKKGNLCLHLRGRRKSPDRKRIPQPFLYQDGTQAEHHAAGTELHDRKNIAIHVSELIPWRR